MVGRGTTDDAGAAAVAEIGSGTGIFTASLLERGLSVYGVEPNPDMRSAAESALSAYPGFRSVAGEAERSGLDDHSVAMVVCAQAFHWFATPAAVAEFERIVVPCGPIVLVWNYRRTDCDPFHEGYERLVSAYGTDYGAINHRNTTPDRIAALFADRSMTVNRFENAQDLDWDGVRGRLDSSSYIPAPPSPEHDELMAAMQELFSQESSNGRVRLRYESVVFSLTCSSRG